MASQQAKERPYFVIGVKPGGGRTVLIQSASSQVALASSLRRTHKVTVLSSYGLPTIFSPSAKRLTLKDMAVLNEQMHQLLSRGVPLVETLTVVSGTVTPGARAVVMHVRDQVAGGSSFAESSLKSGAFDEVTAAVYRAAERTGDLAGACKQLGLSARRTLNINEKAGSLLVYPMVLLMVSLAVSAVLLVVVLPNLGEQLAKTSSVEMPIYSKVLIGFGTFLRQNLAITGLTFGLIIGMILVFRKKLKEVFGAGLRKMPLIRDVVLASEAGRFFSVMSAMVRSGMPMADALSTANRVVSHEKLRLQLDKLRDRLIAGGLLRNLLEDVDALPPATRRLLIAAERAGDMDTAFSALAEDMTAEVDARSARLLAFLSPVLIIIMTGMIGSLLMAVLIPIMRMTSGALG